MPGHSEQRGKPNFRQGDRPQTDRPRQDFSPKPNYPRNDNDARPRFVQDSSSRPDVAKTDFNTPLSNPRPERAPRRFESIRKPQDQNEEYTEPQTAVGGIAEVEALLKNKPGLVHRIAIRKDSGDKRLYELQKLVKHLHIHYQQLDAAQLDELVRPNQGVVALCHEREVTTWDDIRLELFLAIEKDEPKTVAVICNIEDPRNLGACLRSALALGVDAVLLPSKGMCGLTPLAARASAGAISQLNLCRPDNLEAALGELVLAGYDLLGLDSDTPDSIHDTPFRKHTIIAVGGEDRPLPPFIRKQCTKVLRIPMIEAAHSYNASVALTLALYERARSIAFEGMLTPPAPAEPAEE